MKLRPYQERALADIREQYRQGHRAVLLVMPTGAGKTRVLAEAARLTIARGKRVLVLAHTTELVGQAVDKLADVGLKADVEQAALHSASADVVVASIQTMRGVRLEAFAPDSFGLLVHDEAHRTNAATSSGILNHFSSSFLLGVTATPCRSDSRAMGDAYTALVVGATISELTSLGHLVPARTFAPNEVQRVSDLALSVSDAYAKYGAGERAIVFARTVEHAEAIVQEFAPDFAESVHGQSRDRKAILARFASGETRVLASVNVLVEGFDDPGASVAILARRFDHVGGYIQAVGRVLRPHDGKTEARVIDLQGSALVHGTPDTERVYSLDGKGMRLKDRLCLKQCRACGSVVRSTGRAECPLCATPYPVQQAALPTSNGAGVSELVPAKAPKRAFVVKIVAKYPDKCGLCSERIDAGEVVAWVKGQRPRHLTCRERTVAA